MELRPFQKKFVKAVENLQYDTCALSLPRGNGKSALAGHLLTRCLTPGDPLHIAGAEYLLVAASIDQARIVFRFARAALGEDGFRFTDSYTRLGALHKASRTALRVLSSDGRRAMGIVNCPLLVADEPGSWQTVGGGLMHDAVTTAQGKPGSRLKIVYIGTIAPASDGWWPDLIEAGTGGTTYIQVLQGDRDKWDRWPEIRRCNPLTAISPQFRKKLRDERDKARADDRLRARFLSYRLNVPSSDPASVLLSVDDWKRCTARPVPARQGRPVVGVDLGGGRSWSGAVATWRNGRTECFALAPGVPALEAQETRDRAHRGAYTSLHAAGALMVDPGRRVPLVGVLVDVALERWQPEVIICDRFRLGELQDAIAGRCPVVPRVARWSESSADIRALRRGAADGPLAVAPDSRDLLQASLSVASVKTDDQGGTRMVKRDSNNTARDDIAAAWVLAAGLVDRMPQAPAGARYRVCA